MLILPEIHWRSAHIFVLSSDLQNAFLRLIFYRVHPDSVLLEYKYEMTEVFCHLFFFFFLNSKPQPRRSRQALTSQPRCSHQATTSRWNHLAVLFRAPLRHLRLTFHLPVVASRLKAMRREERRMLTGV